MCSSIYLLQVDPVGQTQPVPAQAPPISPSQPYVAVSWTTGELCLCLENLTPDLVLSPGSISPCCPRQCPSALSSRHLRSRLPPAPPVLLPPDSQHPLAASSSSLLVLSPQSWQRALTPHCSCFVPQLLRKSHFSDNFPLVIS